MLKMLLVAAVVTVGGARKDALWNDDFVVTNVTVDLGHLATTNQLAAATGAVEEVAAAKLAAATNDLAVTMSGSIVSASNNLAAAMSHDIAAATNRMESAMGERLEPYATRGWVDGRGYATGPEMRATVREDVRVAVAAAMTGMDGRTAHRLMAPGADGWIDGTGAVWRVERAATWNGETTTNRYDNGTSQGWHAEGWYCGYTAYTSATGTWHLVRYLDAAKRLAVEYVGDGLPGGDGQYEVIAKGVTLDGMPAEPGQVTERGWYQIGDGSSLYYVSPLAETVTVTRVTNAVDRLALASEAGAHGGMTTNDVCGIVTNTAAGWTEWTLSGDVAPGVTYTVDLTGYWYDAETGEAYDEPGDGRYWEGEIVIYGSDGSMGGPEYELPDATSHTFDMYRDEGGETVDAGRITATRRREERNVLGLARHSDLDRAQEGFLRDLAASSNRVDNLAGSVNVLWSHVYGNSAWIAVTNYMRTIEGVVPSFQLWEVRDGATNCVYSSAEEITNLTARQIKDGVAAATNGMPEKAWSKYQSGSGAENPQPGAVTIVSTPNVMLTGGGEWYKFIETGDAAVWVLKSNGLCTFGGDTNGYFRIVDDEGKSQFEIVKTASFEVDAIATNTTFDASDNFTVTYNANTKNPPTLYAAASLDDQFVGEDASHNINSLGISVAWAKNESGYWVATVHQDSRLPRLFVHAKVLQEGQNAIRNTAPTLLDGGLIIGGVKYTIVPYTNGGKTYLTLEAAQ